MPSVAAIASPPSPAAAEASPASAQAPSAPMAAQAPGAAQAAPAPAAPGPAKTSTAPSPDSAPKKGKEAPPADGRAASLVVYTGQLAMLTENGKMPESIDAIIDVAESLGGGLMGRRDDGVDIRVPSSQFRTALKGIEKVAPVTARSVKADDVTEQVHDLEVRLSNLKATQKRLQDFLSRAQNVNEALTVGRELERVAQEIDVIEGRVGFLRSRASFSQISVALREKPKEQPLVVVTPPPPPPKVIPPSEVPNLPVPWLERLGVDPVLSISKP